MKKRLFFLLLTFQFIYCSAQPYYFNNRYDFNGYSEAARSIVPTDSGYIVAGGASNTGGFPIGIGLLWIAKDGTEQAKRTFFWPFNVYHGSIGSFIKNNSYGYSLAGSMDSTGTSGVGYLARFNDAADTLWCRAYPGIKKREVFYHHTQTSNGDYICVGWSDTLNSSGNSVEMQMLILRTDSSGNIKFRKRFGLPTYRDYAYSVLELPNNDIVVGGQRVLLSNNTGGPVVYCLDSLGNIKWSQDFLSPYGGNAAIVYYSTDGFIYFGAGFGYSYTAYTNTKAMVVKMDTAGTVIWNKKYGDITPSSSLFNIIELPNNELALFGQANSPAVNGTSIGTFYKINTNGDSLFYNKYEKCTTPSSHDYFMQAIKTDDNGYAICGFVQPGSLCGGNQDMWVLKIDSLGCEMANCGLGLNDPSGNETDMIVYPNPSAESFTFEVSKGYEANKAEITIYDFSGSLIERIYFAGGECRTTWKPATSTSGIFFYELKNGGDITKRGKIVLIK